MARVTFDSLFKLISAGIYEPRQKIRIAGVVIGPGVQFTKGVTFGGVDLTLFQKNDFEIDVDEDTLILKSIYAEQL